MRSLVAAAALCILLLTLFLLSGCSPLYVMRAAVEEGKILLGREPIPKLIGDPETPPEVKLKLQIVSKARNFAAKMGLTPGESFTQYSEIDRPVLAWVLLASKRTAFEPYTWWYPIVGTVPYKGFFERENAQCLADELEDKGYETWLRGTDAFSTLGWFNDPILSTTLQREPYVIANTVIHEIFHATLWIPGSVAFNESAANFVGLTGAEHFFREKTEACGSECPAWLTKSYEQSRKLKLIEFALSVEMAALVTELEHLYRSNRSEEEKLAEREEIFTRQMKGIREEFPFLTLFESVNNAEIMQRKLYMTELKSFEQLFRSCKGSWSCFLEKMQELKRNQEESGDDPFKILSAMVSLPES